MTQVQKINDALKEKVIAALLDDGFAGKFPHYKKMCGNHIKFISFDKDKYGNAFRVMASIAFPSEEPEYTNINYRLIEFDGKSDLTADELDIGYCLKHYFLRGNLGDDFCYSDVWWDLSIGMANRVSEKRAKDYKKKWYEIKLQSAGDEINEKICDKINKQIPKIYKWWDKQIKQVEARKEQT